MSSIEAIKIPSQEPSSKADKIPSQEPPSEADKFPSQELTPEAAPLAYSKDQLSKALRSLQEEGFSTQTAGLYSKESPLPVYDPYVF